ncbi:MAG TPA: radical SAM protein, partial [Lachnospiraceae bacterium]|nr:radical SAM protein [Lachnospiraceae bacterium]
ALEKSKDHGLQIPIVYNTGGYEKAETLKFLSGLVDIYLPDLKYYSTKLSSKYSNAPDYFQFASEAIAEMYRQVGTPIMDHDTELMRRGIIVRHLLLPRHLADSKKIISYLHDTYRDNIYLSIMSQYTPMRFFPNMPELSRRVTRTEYRMLLDYCIQIGIENAFIQEGDTASESFIPPFDCEGI